jgi:hypothetical protein
MDHGYQTWNRLHMRKSDQNKVPSDVLKARSWGLIHHPMFHTYPQHNGEGFATWVEVDSGVNFWVILQPKHIHADRRSLYNVQTSFLWANKKYLDDIEALVITAYPEDVM